MVVARTNIRTGGKSGTVIGPSAYNGSSNHSTYISDLMLPALTGPGSGILNFNYL